MSVVNKPRNFVSNKWIESHKGRKHWLKLNDGFPCGWVILIERRSPSCYEISCNGEYIGLDTNVIYAKRHVEEYIREICYQTVKLFDEGLIENHEYGQIKD